MQRNPILVVEDDEDIRDFVVQALSDAGYAVMDASNGAEALAQVDRQPPKAILLDMRMPVMDGWRFAELYRTRPQKAPIIVMTAAHDAQARAAEVGAAGLLGKPFDLDGLLDVVQRTIQP
jgi:two-component system chemotaxis response regulator CheY